jgi:hypothetical protein
MTVVNLKTRRTFLALTAGVALTLTAACGTTGTPSASESTTPATTASAASNTKDICTQFKAKLEPMMVDIGKAVGLWIGFRQAGATDQAKLAEDAAKAQIIKSADELVKLGDTATDPKVKADLAKAAGNMKASADLKFLSDPKIKTISDIQEPLVKEATAWMAPLASTCETK